MSAIRITVMLMLFETVFLLTWYVLQRHKVIKYTSDWLIAQNKSRACKRLWSDAMWSDNNWPFSKEQSNWSGRANDRRIGFESCKSAKWTWKWRKNCEKTAVRQQNRRINCHAQHASDAGTKISWNVVLSYFSIRILFVQLLTVYFLLLSSANTRAHGRAQCSRSLSGSVSSFR